MFFSGMITFLSTVGLRVWAQFSRRDETIARVATLLVFTGIVNMIAYFNSTPGPASAHWTHNMQTTALDTNATDKARPVMCARSQ